VHKPTICFQQHYVRKVCDQGLRCRVLNEHGSGDVYTFPPPGDHKVTSRTVSDQKLPHLSSQGTTRSDRWRHRAACSPSTWLQLRSSPTPASCHRLRAEPWSTSVHQSFPLLSILSCTNVRIAGCCLMQATDLRKLSVTQVAYCMLIHACLFVLSHPLIVSSRMWKVDAVFHP